MQEQDLQLIASQLSCPTGEQGIEIGNKMNELNAFITNKSIEALSVNKDDSIVEIGPGNGVLSKPILDILGFDGHYIAIEASDVMAAELHRTLKDKRCSTEIICEDCLNINIEKDSIDGIMGVNILYFVDDLIQFFNHIYGWMKPGGRAVFGIRSDKALEKLPFTKYGFNIRSTFQIEKYMKNAGFSGVKSVTFEEGEVPFGDITIPVDSVIIVGEKA